MLFDDAGYIATLDWIGQPVGRGACCYVARRIPGTVHWDARGSWPYQSAPDPQALDAMVAQRGSAGDRTAPLTWTGVIRPDRPLPASPGTGLSTLVRPLKPHLWHDPCAAPAQARYSARTRRRLQHARSVFDVRVSPFRDQWQVISTWQERLARRRGIPAVSSPDAAHFRGISRLEPGLTCIELRDRAEGSLRGGLLLAFASDTGAWHAHSCLVDDGVREAFGSFLLYDAALERLGDRPIYWGGQPSGANGAGVFRFKQRFSNASAMAHLMSIDIARHELDRLRASRPAYAWMPDYRNPGDELAHC